MSFREQSEKLFQSHMDELSGCAEFKALEEGRASREGIVRWIMNIVRTHVRSPKLLAFLYALAPPETATETLRHNLLEELGVEDEVAHPELLKHLLQAAGLGAQWSVLSQEADDDLKRHIAEPLLYGTLKEVGLAALAEVVAFEFMLSRLASRIAKAIAKHRGLDAGALEWFTHHSEVDIRHAAQGLDNLLHYVRWYEFSDDDALTILKMAFRENVFIKRYFGELAQARAKGGI